MAPILNKMNLHCAVVGNHDLDFGLERAEKIIEKCNFPWLLSNITDKQGQPLAGTKKSLLLDHKGHKIGFIGLAERDWLDSLSFDKSNVLYEDFIISAKKIGEQLRKDGAELVVALTHMRKPNDIKLADAIENHQIDFILGGHDHFYEVFQQNNLWVIKGGFNWQHATKVDVIFGGPRPTITVETIKIDTTTEPDQTILEIATHYQNEFATALMKEFMWTNVQLDAKHASLRANESSLANWITDICASHFSVDCAFVTAGTFRSDDTFGPGAITLKNLSETFPFSDIIVVIELSGEELKSALENGAQSYPGPNSKLLHVDHQCSYTADPNQPVGQKVVSAIIGNAPLNLEKNYKVACPYFLTKGGDGFLSLKGKKYIVEAENGIDLKVLIRNFVTKLKVVSVLLNHSEPERKVVSIMRGNKNLLPEINPTCTGRIKLANK